MKLSLTRGHLAKLAQTVFLTSLAIVGGANAQAGSSIQQLLGRWDLTLSTPAGELPSWIEITEDNDQPAMLMVGIVDHAKPLKTFKITNAEIEFVSPKGEEGFSSDMLFRGKLVGSNLVGTVTDTSGNVSQWSGTRAPEIRRTNAPRWGEPAPLFDGKSLRGWSLIDPKKSGTWKVQDGNLVTRGHGSDLVHAGDFEDFKLHLEFKCGASSNSGVYLRGRYELQIETDSAAQPKSQHTGGVYGFLDPKPEQPRRADEWQRFDITLIGRTLTVVQNGVLVIDRKEIPGITGGALDSHEGNSGPIYLQGSEEGMVSFRNIMITPAL